MPSNIKIRRCDDQHRDVTHHGNGYTSWKWPQYRPHLQLICFVVEWWCSKGLCDKHGSSLYEAGDVERSQKYKHELQASKEGKKETRGRRRFEGV